MADGYVRIGAIAGLAAITADAFRLTGWGRHRLLDSNVDLYLSRQVTDTIRTMHGDRVDGIPKTVDEIANGSKVPRWLVGGCLKRLLKERRVAEDKDGRWRTASR